MTTQTPPSNRTYRVSIDSIHPSCQFHLLLFLNTYATEATFTDDLTKATAICPSAVLASLIFLFMESDLECNISYRKL